MNKKTFLIRHCIYRYDYDYLISFMDLNFFIYCSWSGAIRKKKEHTYIERLSFFFFFFFNSGKQYNRGKRESFFFQFYFQTLIFYLLRLLIFKLIFFFFSLKTVKYYSFFFVQFSFSGKYIYGAIQFTPQIFFVLSFLRRNINIL